MNRRTQRRATHPLRRAAFTIAATVVAAVHARAVDSVWTGTSGAWSNPANWSDGVPAVAGDIATVDTRLATYPTIRIDDVNVTLSRLTVNLGRFFNIIGTRSLTVDQIEPFQDGSVTFNLPVILTPGATVGWAANPRAGRSVLFKGPIAASGAVTFVGKEGRDLVGDTSAFTAALTIRGGSLFAHELRFVTAVNLQGGAGFGFNDSGYFNAYRDRLNDAAPLTFNGGSLGFGTNAWQGFSETIGPTTLAGGHNTISVDYSQGPEQVLTITSLTRQRGATLQLRRNGSGDPPLRVLLKSAPVLTGGIIGGWAVGMGVWPSLTRQDYDFLSYTTADGLRPLGPNGRPTAIQSARPADNVLLTAAPTAPLAADATINSLLVRNTTYDRWTLDLGGRTLNLVTGGLLSHGLLTLTNGTLTAGGTDPAGAELFTLDAIDADIVDNPAGGPVSVVVSGPGPASYAAWVRKPTVLSGRNTYSGRTMIGGGTLHIASATALPAGTPIDMTGGEFGLKAPGLFSVGPVVLRDGAAIRSLAFGATMDAPSYTLEWGTVAIPLVGTGPITKTTGSIVNISGSTDYAGSVDIYEGDLNVEASPTTATPRPLGTAPIAVHGGKLRLNGLWLDNPITLAGGALTAFGNGTNGGTIPPSARNTGEFAGPMRITADSAVNTSEGAHVRMSGPVNFEANTTLRKTGESTLVISGPITAAPGAALDVVDYGLALISGANQNLTLLGHNDASISFATSTSLDHLSLTDRASVTLAAGSRLLTLRAVTLADSSTLNLTDGALVLDYAATSPAAQLRSDILANRLTSSLKSPTRTLGYAEAADVLSFASGAATFLGQTIDSTTLLVRLTVPGDATLDGLVNFDDLLALAKRYNATGDAATWSAGDFTYDGVVNFDDLLVLAKNYNAVLPAAIPLAGAAPAFEADLAAAAAAAVPEPALLASLAFICGRRRRR